MVEALKERFEMPGWKEILALVYWPLFGIAFYMLEWYPITDTYYSVHSVIDDYIPFCEYFLIPYLFWFVFMFGMHVYTLLCNHKAFHHLMKFISITYTVGLIMFVLFPTCQNLRPVSFEHTNVLTDLLQWFYTTDTNTNVTPSLHVVGAVAVWYSSRQCEEFKTKKWSLFFGISTFLICISTVFVKQHSIIDVLIALVICIFTEKLLEYRPAYHQKLSWYFDQLLK